MAYARIGCFMNNIVLITGCSNGIGLHLAGYLAEHGYTVYAGVRNLNNRDIPGLKHHNIIQIELDITEEANIKAAVAHIILREGHIDHLINNAGFGVSGAIEAVPMSEFHRQFETNYFGTVALIKEVVPHMRERRSGRIINVSSVVGQMPFPFGGVYSSSKLALEGISTALRYELAPFGIDVVIVQPGYIRTNFIGALQQTGLPVYDKYEAKFADKANKVRLNLGTTVEATSRAIYKIMNKRKPKPRYSVGLDAAIGLGFRRIFGDNIIDRILLGQVEK